VSYVPKREIIKAMGFVGSRPQRLYTTKEEMSSPMASIETMML